MRDPAAPTPEQIRDRPEQGPASIVDLALHRNRARPDTVSSARPPALKSTLTRRVVNQPVRAPRCDWEAIVTGRRRMYRTYSENHHDRFARLIPPGSPLPRPVVLYSRLHQQYRRVDTALAIVLEYRQEPLGAISPADLRAEGFMRDDTPLEQRTAINRFRRYWKRRYVRWGWRPNDRISVVTLRPWTEDDYDWTCDWLFDHLYGDWRDDSP